MKVYTYQHDYPNSHNEWARQIWLWKQSWAAHGFEPVVLSQADAEKHYLYQPLSEIVRAYPTLNDRTYEHACFVRHLAFDLAGAQLISDYDVVFDPRAERAAERVRASVEAACGALTPVSLDDGGNISLAVFPGGCFTPLIHAILNADLVAAKCHELAGAPHISDMLVFMLGVERVVRTGTSDTLHNLRRRWRQDDPMLDAPKHRYPLIHVNNDSRNELGFGPLSKSILMGQIVKGERNIFV